MGIDERTRDELLTGRRTPPAPCLRLHAGPVTCTLDGADLRDVRRGGRVIAQRVYMAVRDEGWGTVPGELRDVEVDQRPDGFEVRFRSRHRQGPIDVDWAATIVGGPDGTISYRMDAVALTAFRYCKIGFNVHHPLLETVGRRYRATGEDGSELSGVISPQIEPQRVVDGRLTAMFDPYSTLTLDYLDGAEVHFGFRGDLFEMQDHRNWADGNFKSYGTPLSVPWPMDAAEGLRIGQEVTITSVGLPDERHGEAPVEVRVGGPARRARLPRLGLGRPTGGGRLDDREAALVAMTRPAHLRVPVRFHEPGWPVELTDAAADLERLGAAAELAVSSEEGSELALAELAEHLTAHGIRVARVLALERQDAFTPVAPITTPATLARVRTALAPVLGDVPFAGGSDQFFSDVNRDPPATEGLDALCFGLCPQVHAADDVSLMENLAALPDCVETARALRPGLPVAVSPVTLAARLGPYPGGAPGADGPPGSVDVRQHALFGASWTLGAIAWLSDVAAESVTLYETTGPQGVVRADASPLLHVLADVAERADGSLRDTVSSEPLDVAALALDGPAGLRVLLANHTPEPRSVVVAGVAGTGTVRTLDEATAPEAMAAPQAFRRACHRLGPIDGTLRLTLGPYAVACLDLSDGQGTS